MARRRRRAPAGLLRLARAPRALGGARAPDGDAPGGAAAVPRLADAAGAAARANIPTVFDLELAEGRCVGVGMPQCTVTDPAKPGELWCARARATR